MNYEAVIGLEIHAELETESKMFCACPVVDSTAAAPNIAVCPICSGMPGVLPVVNRRAVEYALRVALSLNCRIEHTSLFARKNYFYPDLPKGYQISQYEQPLARNGYLPVQTSQGEKIIRIRRVHMEEDTGKLTHINREDRDGKPDHYSLVDLNRAGIPLLEIVTEPDMHTPEEVRLCAMGLRSVLRYVGANSGDMQRGVLRIEPNVSVRPGGASQLGTRVEIKNLNSFRALERSVAYEIQHQVDLLEQGKTVQQQTLGWDVNREETFTQRVKEGEDDYRYFPEPDLPPLVIEPEWVEQVRSGLPELPAAKIHRFQSQYGLNPYNASVLAAERDVANYFEEAAAAAPGVSSKMLANWISGELFARMNQAGVNIAALNISARALAELLQMVTQGEINTTTAKTVLDEMAASGKSAREIASESSLGQISDIDSISGLVQSVLAQNPEQTAAYLNGKETVSRWLFGQVMRAAKGQANPQIVQRELERQLTRLKQTGRPAESAGKT
ncbi:MAG: Asp-tRNA(Asn)/Glu-tRNA(Gln) amidotransferase subunit GatB [Omnitrophica WOR_2 bacterium]